MKSNLVFLLAFAIGIIAGLRSMTAPAVVSWAAHLKWIDLSRSYVSFLGSIWSAVIISVLAIVELIVDKLPSTPSRTTAVPLTARIITGAFSGAALSIAANQLAAIGALLGGIGGIAGTFIGFHVRRYLVNNLNAPDKLIAILEDLTAIAAGLWIASAV